MINGNFILMISFGNEVCLILTYDDKWSLDRNKVRQQFLVYVKKSEREMPSKCKRWDNIRLRLDM